MPNWSKGCLKVRGKAANVKKFVLEGLKPFDFSGYEPCKLELSDIGEIETDKDCWIEGTTRGYVENLCVDFSFVEDDETFMALLDARFAYRVDAEELLTLCRKYSIDMKLYAFEKDMEFNQDSLIVDGKILNNLTIVFENYNWECICPTLGGW
jgi:hypothetical protein|nr:MAG TPA: hypothetical protein [Caudoviricetes sp.]